MANFAPGRKKEVQMSTPDDARAPVGFGAGRLPLSMQVVGRPFAEGTVLRVVDAYQRRTDHHLQVPPIAATVAA